jgi:U3 small nucleolar RNA-associated protein 21
LRCTSVVRDSRSFELSQGEQFHLLSVHIINALVCTGSLAKKASMLSIPLASLKLPVITSMSYSSARAKDWDDILTGHTDESCTRSWTMLQKKLGKHSLSFNGGNIKGNEKQNGLVGSVQVWLIVSFTMYQYHSPQCLLAIGSLRNCLW